MMLIDCLQYCNWSEKIFTQWRDGGVDAVHATVAYHEDYDETLRNIAGWNRLFEIHPGRITRAATAADIIAAKAAGKTAVFFGLQNPAPMGDNIARLESLYEHNVRFMQLTYNRHSLLGSGCYESEDRGLTRFGGEVIHAMNRMGMVVDLSHAGGQTCLDAIAQSQRPVAISHANPFFWHEAPRNISDKVLDALGESGGMLGFSLYPLHLNGGSDCTLDNFCGMIARVAERIGIAHIGFGSDLCQDQPHSVVGWMRSGSRDPAHHGEAKFPPMPQWFRDNRDWGNIMAGLAATGFSQDEIAKISGGNWLAFFEKSFTPSDTE